MSMPEFQTTALTREEAINQIIASIAMEELGLSHIINAEGEKLQYVLGTLTGTTGPSPSATIEDVLKVNDSVRSVLQTAAESQSMLRNKLQAALSSSVMTGPTGPRGATGPNGYGQILPFSSGSPMGLTTDAAGKAINPGILGVNELVDAELFTPEGDINLKDGQGVSAEFAFLVPHDCTITDLVARFYLTETLTLAGTSATLSIQIFQEAESELFKPIGGAQLVPVMTPAGSPYKEGTMLSVTKHDLDIAVPSGARLLIAFKAQSSDAGTALSVIGYGHASIGIS